MTKEPTRELIETQMLEAWGLNPRGGELREIPEFAAQIEAEGGIKEDLHVFPLNGRLIVMQGHRRLAVAVRLGIAQVWCKVYEIDEREAFLLLLTLQNGVDPFDARELALAARTAVGLDIDRGLLIGAMHRDEATVQLYLDLGRLPHRAQEMVYKRKMGLGTAGHLLRLMELTNATTVQEVLPDLTNAITGEPMTEEQARVFLEERYFKPLKQRGDWLKLSADLAKKKYRKSDGFDFVDWELREQFVMEGAIPQTAYARAEEHIEESLLVDAGKPVMWGALAQVLGVPVFVCPAPHADGKFLLLVRMSAVRDGDSVREEGERVLLTVESRRKAAERRRVTVDEGREAPVTVVDDCLPGTEEDEADRSVRAPFPLERWRAVMAKLLARKDAVMQDALWKPLVSVQWEALSAVLPPEVYAAMMGEMNRDETGNRRGLRWCFLAVMALAMCEGNLDDMETEIGEIEERLGIEDD